MQGLMTAIAVTAFTIVAVLIFVAMINDRRGTRQSDPGRMGTALKKGKPVGAKSVNFTSCGCGSVWIRFHDVKGEIFAYACLPLQNGFAAADEIRAESMKALTARQCEGHA